MDWIDITPVAKPRMTQRDKWAKRPCVLKYRAFCDELRIKHPDPLPESVHLIFLLSMPKSWSEKKKAEMHLKPHKSKPDIDNLIKSVLDAKCDNDSHIHTVCAEKKWAKLPALYVSTLTDF